MRSLFTKLSYQGTAKGLFGLQGKLRATGAPVYHMWLRVHTIPFIAELQAKKAVNINLYIFGLGHPGIKSKYTVSVADALSTRPLIGYNLQNDKVLF